MILLTGGVPHPPKQTPTSPHPPEQRPPWSRHPPGSRHPPEQTPPRSRDHSPREQTPRLSPPPEHAVRCGQRAGGTHPTGMQSCTILLSDVSTRCLETLVTFAYSGEMDFTGCDPSAIWPLLCACSELQMPDALHLCNKFLDATTNRNSSNNNQLEPSNNNNNSRRKVTSHGNDDDSDDVSLRHLRDAAKRKRGRPSVGAKSEGRPTKRSRKGTDMCLHKHYFGQINS